MPETALILCPAGSGPFGGAPGDMLGLSFTERAVHTAARSGARSVFLVRRRRGGSGATGYEWRRRAKIEKISPVVLDTADGDRWRPLLRDLEGPVLVVDERTVFSPALVEAARLAGVGARECAVFRGPGERATGLGLCPGSRVEAVIDAWKASGDGELWGEGLSPAATLPVAGGFAVPVHSAELYREAHRALLSSVRKATDGFVSRHLNRPVSLQLSRLFIRLGLTPNGISIGNLLLGLVGALAAATGTYASILLGGFLFQASSVIDGSDGEVAKLTFSDSDRGSWIDTLCDELTVLAFFTALPVGMYRRTGNPVYLGLIILTLLSAGCLYVLMIRYVRRRGSHGSMVQILDDFRKSAGAPGIVGRITAVVSALDFVVRRDFFSFLIFILCILDMSAAVVWILAALTAAAVAFFAIFSSRSMRSEAQAMAPHSRGNP